MADSDLSIHNFGAGTLTENSLFVIAFPSAGVGYATGNISAGAIGESMLIGLPFNSLNTADKHIVPAINELLLASNQAGTAITGTLTAGSTSITLTNNAIHTDSAIDYFTDTFGVIPSNVTVSEGSVTLTFDAQQSDVDVMVIIRGYQVATATAVDNSYVYNYLSGSNDHPRVIWTYTATEDVDLYLSGTGYTNTGANEGRFDLYVDGIVVDTQNLPTETETAFDFGKNTVSSGSVVEIKTDWAGSHTNCTWTLRMALTEVT